MSALTLDILITPKIDQGALDAQTDRIKSDLSGLGTALPPIDATGLVAPLDEIHAKLQEATEAWLPLESAAEGAGAAVKGALGDVPSPAKSIAETASQFHQAKQAALDMGASQHAALAQMIVDGKQGSAEYHSLIDSIRQTESELHKLEQAEKQAANATGGSEKGGFFEKFKEGAPEALSMVAGFAGAGAVIGGVTGLASAVEGLFEAGKQQLEMQERLEIGFRQAGLSDAALDEQLEKTNKFAGELSEKWAVGSSKIKEYAQQAAFLGGATGKANEDLTQLAVGIEKASGGILQGGQVIKAFSRGLNDPEAQANLGRLKAAFPELATALVGVKSPADQVKKAMEVLGPTFDTLSEQAKGPLGSIERTENSLSSLKKTAGTALVEGLGPFISLFADGVSKSVGLVKPFLKDLTEGASNAANGAIAFLKDGFDKLAPVLVLVGQYAKGYVVDVFNEVQGIWSASIETVEGLVDAVIGTVQAFLPLGAAGKEQIDWMSVAKTSIVVLEGGFHFLSATVVATVQTISASVKGIGGAIRALSTGDISGAWDSIKGAGEEVGNAWSTQIGGAVDKIKADLVNADLGTTISSAAQIKEKLDKSNHIGELIKSFEEAKKKGDEIGAAKFGKEIKDQAPEAITAIRQITDEHGKLHTVYDIDSKKALEFAEARKASLSSELQAKTAVFNESLGAQAQQFAKNKTALAAMGNEITATAKRGGDVKELSAKYAELEKTVESNRGTLVKTFTDGKNAGLAAAGSAEELAAKYHLSVDEAKSLSTEVAGVEDATKGAADAAAELAGRFDDNLKSLQEQKKTLISAGAQQHLDGQSTVETQKKINELSEQERRAKAAQDALDPEKQAALQKQRDDKAKQARDKAKHDADELNSYLLKSSNDVTDLIRQIETSALTDRHAAALRAIEDEKDKRLGSIDQELQEAQKKFHGGNATINLRLGKIDPQSLLDQAKELADLDAATLQQRLDALGTNANKRLLVEIQYLQKVKAEAITLIQQDLDKRQKTIDESLKHQLDNYKTQEGLITANTVEAITRRQELHLQELQLSQSMELEALARGTEEFKKGQDEILRNSGGKTTDQVQAEVATLIKNIIANAGSETAIGFAKLKFGDEISKSVQETNRALGDARIHDIEDDVERERSLRLAAIDKTFEDEIAKAGANRALVHDAIVKHEASLYDVKVEFAKKTNDLVVASLSIEKGLREGFGATIDPVEQERSKKRIAEIDSERGALLQKYREGKIAAEEFSKRESELGKERYELQTTLDQKKFDLSRSLGNALVTAGKDFEKEKQASVEAGVTKLTELSKAGLGFTKEAGVAQLELMKNFGLATLGTLSSSLGEMIAQGNISLKSLGSQALGMLFDFAKKQVAIQSPAIIAMFQSFIPPPFGLIAGAAAVGILEAGLSALQGSIHLNKGGVVPGSNPSLGDVVPAMLTPTERVFDSRISKREEPLFDYLHTNQSKTSKDFFMEHYSHSYVDENGALHTQRMADAIARQGEHILRLQSDMSNAVAMLAEGQQRIADRYESHSAFSHEFGEIAISGQAIRTTVVQSAPDDVALG